MIGSIGSFLLAKTISTSSESEASEESSNSSDEELIMINLINKNKKHLKIKNYVNNVMTYSLEDFQSHFRFSKTTVENLLHELQLFSVFGNHVTKPSVSPLEGLLLTLWLLANEEVFRSVADRFGFSRGHAHSIFIKTLKQICRLKDNYIQWPLGAQLVQVVANFNQLRHEHSFPNVAGIVDGCHILIPAPKDDNSFYNRKGQHSMILQGVCNSKMEFIDTFCGWPGSAHDARVWRNSPIYAQLQNNLLPAEFHLLGDSAYPLDTFLMVPFKDNGHLSMRQKKYNSVLANTRVKIENAFARLKGIWRRLRYLNVTNLRYFKYIVTAACILHNIGIREKLQFENLEMEEEIPPANDNINNAIEAITKRNDIMQQL